MRSMPYFDEIIRRFTDDPESDLAAAFARHVHWGYYAEGDGADASLASYLSAAEAMTEAMCRLAEVRDRHEVLDVGCGFGGTIAHLDERLEGAGLTGLNIDRRQLRRADATVRPDARNRVAFVAGDAVALPFPDATFDAVLAIECAFHFPSRKQFLREARRVTRPGGRVVISDFLRGSGSLRDATAAGTPQLQPFYGANSAPVKLESYARMARVAGLELTRDDDVTTETLPTYGALRELYRRAGLPDGVEATDQLEAVARSGSVQYHLLAFEVLEPLDKL